MRNIVRKTVTLNPLELNVSVEKSGGGLREQSSSDYVQMEHGDHMTITFDHDAFFQKYETIISARLRFETVLFEGSPLLWIYCLFPTPEEYPTYTETAIPEFDFNLNTYYPESPLRQITIDCQAFQSDNYAIVKFTQPYIELTYETDYSNSPTTKTLPLSEDAAATLYIPSGKTAFSVLDIRDPILDFSFTHHRTPQESPCWRTNLDETLSENGKVYTDALGFVHQLKERFYSLKDTGEKVFVTSTAAAVTADADGSLWYMGDEVFRDLRSADGLHATARLKGINNAEWIEQRYEEERQISEQLRAHKDYLCSFVKVNRETGRTTALTQATLSFGNSFESLYHAKGSFLTAAEAEQLLSVSSDIATLEAKDSLTAEEQETLATLQAQLNLLSTRAEDYPEVIRARYADYRATKAQLESLEESLPVTFLFSDEGAKGYNKNGALVTIQPKGGKSLLITRERYNSIGSRRVTSVEDEQGNAMRFYYDIYGKLSRVVNSLGEEAFFTYEGSKLHTIKRPHAPTVTFGYSGNCITSVADEYTASTFSFGPTGRLLSYSRSTDVTSVVHGTVERGTPTTLASLAVTYEEDRVKISDLLRNKEELYYHENHLVTDTYVIENGKVAFCECVVHDNETELVTEKYAASPACLGKYTLEEFEFEGIASSEEYYTYNDFHECTKVSATHYTPEEEVKERVLTNITYNEKGKPVRTRTERTLILLPTSEEKTTVTEELCFYNAKDELIKRESYTVGKEHLLGKDIEELSYDAYGRETVCASYNTLAPSDKLYTEKSYDSLGRLSTELDETGRFETELSYIGETARLRAVKDVRGTSLAYAYDESGREVSVTTATEEGEADTESVYYTASLPVCAVSQRHVFNYTYDGKGRVTRITLDGWDYLTRTYTENEDGTETVTTAYAGFESAPLSVTKDKFGEVKSRVREGVKSLSYTYTPDGRLLTEADALSGRTKTYGYDGELRLNGYTDTLGVTESLSYDEESRVTERVETANESNVTSTFFYDEDTERLSEMQMAGFDIYPSYDPLDRECKRTVWRTGHFLHEAKTDFAKYGDHATMRPSALTLSSPTDSKRLKYSYDEMGNIEKIYENGMLSSRYEYDAPGRLTREDNRALQSTTLWEYDQGGNILSRRTYPFTVKKTFELMENEPTDTLLYEYAGDHLVSLNGAQPTHYSAEGHPDTYRGKPVTWYAPRMLATFDGIPLTYNSDGLCASIAGKPLLYSRDGRLLTDVTFRYLYDESGSLFGFLRAADGAEYIYRRDALGNIIAILDNTGAVVVQYKYDAWGNHVVLDASGNAITDPNHIGNLNPHRYRGYYYSTALGLYYLKSRFYDAEIGRFICADSLDYLDPHTVGGLNLFSYCNNNPVMNVDPTGHAWWKRLNNSIAKFLTGVVEGVKHVVDGIANSIGAVISTGKEIPTSALPADLPFVFVEEGVGYNKDFGNDKTINFFATGDSVVDGAVGIDAVSNTGYGLGVEFGLGRSALSLHLGSSSIELGVHGFFKAYYKQTTKEKSGYIYTKVSIDTNRAAVNFIIRYIVPFLLSSKVPNLKPVY